MADDVLQRELYGRVEQDFDARLGSAVDIQSDFAERLELIDAVIGAKPSFFAFVSAPGRIELYKTVTVALEEIGTIPDLRWGWDRADVHVHRRKLNLRVPDLEAVVATKSERSPVIWVTLDRELADAYRSGAPNLLGEERLLGYPSCCASWHHDVYFARPLEAFVDVMRLHPSREKLQEYFSGWTPTPGEKDFFPLDLSAAPLFRSNAALPFIPHVACPRCLGDPGSASHRQNSRMDALGLRLDPELHAKVIRETRTIAARLPAMIARPRRMLEDEADRLELSVAARDAYLRHGRHWLGAMGLS